MQTPHQIYARRAWCPRIQSENPAIEAKRRVSPIKTAGNALQYQRCGVAVRMHHGTVGGTRLGRPPIADQIRANNTTAARISHQPCSFRSIAQNLTSLASGPVAPSPDRCEICQSTEHGQTHRGQCWRTASGACGHNTINIQCNVLSWRPFLIVP